MSFLKFDNVTGTTADIKLSDVVRFAIRNGYIDLGASASADAPDTAIATREDIKFSGGHMFQIIEHNGPLETIPQGTIPANGQKVYEYLYPKQYAKIIAGHQFAVTEVLWNSGISGNADAYKGCWSLGGEDEYGNWVRAPKLNADTNYRAPFLRGSQIGVDAGKLALDQFQKHWHASGDTVDTAPGSRQAAAATSGNYPVYNLSDLAAQRLLPSTKYLPDGGGVPRVGDETHPRYHGVIMCIRMFGAVSNPGSLDAAQLATDLAVVNAKIGAISSNGMRNKIINGKMEIAQRGTSFPALSSGGTYTLDRWVYIAGLGSPNGAVAASQQSDAPANTAFRNSLRLTVNSAVTALAADSLYAVKQVIEGYNVRDLIGKTFTLSFLVRSSKTGIHCVDFRNQVNVVDRSYIAEYTVNEANTWERKTVTVPNGLITDGNWNWAEGAGLQVNFTLAAGTNFQGVAGKWQVGNLTATVNQVNCLDTVGNTFAITGVQLEAGEVATPFEHRPYGMELSLCYRYYEMGRCTAFYNNSSSGGVIGVGTNFTVTKRVVPTIALSYGSLQQSSVFGFSSTGSISPTSWYDNVSYTASSEL